MKNKKYASIVIIGRIPFDDEDSCCSCQNMTKAEACDAFVAQVYQDAGRTDQDEVAKDAGSPVIVNYILHSASLIERD